MHVHRRRLRRQFDVHSLYRHSLPRTGLLSGWYRALTLAERRALTGDGAPHDVALAARRLQRWRELIPDLFDTRLSDAGYTLSEFEALLGTTRTIPVPPWVDTLSEPGSAGSGLRAWLEPLTSAYAHRLGDLGPALMAPLARRLETITERCLALEIGAMGLEGSLSGETPEARFDDFATRLRDVDFRMHLFETYPVAARLVGTMLDLWFAASRGFLERLARDRPILENVFGVKGALAAIEGAAGDPHCGGRRTCIVRFDNGVRIVYKPRSLQVDQHFQGLVEWLNTRGLSPTLRTVRILVRDGYGWMEYVEGKACSTSAQVADFYRRQGAWLALFHVLAGTDMHCDNLLADGENPVPVDLETLFHPALYRPAVDTADEAAQTRLRESVLAVGLLPRPQRVEGETSDWSGLAGGSGALSPMYRPVLEGIGTDDVRVVEARGRVGTVQHRAKLGDIVAEVDTAALLEGFDSGWDLLAWERDGLHQRLQTFAHDPVRVVIRPSMRYFSLLQETWHPRALRDALVVERLLDQLWQEVPMEPPLRRCIDSEKAQLRVADIPYFSTTPTSPDLTGGDGSRLENVLADPGEARALDRLSRLTAEEKDAQRWLVLGSLARCKPVETPRPVSISNALSAAEAVARRLRALAVRGGGQATWLTLSFHSMPTSPDDGTWQVGVVGADLYEGLPGVILFLARLADVTGEGMWRVEAEAALRTLRARLPGLALDGFPGAFAGWGGLVYLFTHLAVLWGEEDLFDTAERAVRGVQASVPGDTCLDVIAGCAGAIPCLLGLASVRPESRALDVAVACGDHLLQSDLKLPFQRGFSHGLAGAAWALERLAEVSGEARFRAASKGAFAAEDGLLSKGQWTDRHGSQATWCHGAPGLALARIGRNPARLLEVAAKAPWPDNHSLCHGEIGNLVILQRVALGSASTAAAGIALGTERLEAVLDRIRRTGWRCALPHHLEAPGLMTGLAGIGYGLLRLAHPERVPCVLSIDPPLR